MGRVLTNFISLAYSIESALGVAGTAWKSVEPNGINTFGATTTKVSRNPISKRRRRRKTSVTDLDSAVEFETDLMVDTFADFVEGFMFSTAINADGVFVGSDVTASGYTIPAATAAQAAKFQWVTGGHASLVYAQGYVNAGNNGLKALTADLGSTDTALPVTGLTAETAPTNAQVELAGVRAQLGDLAISVSGTVATLSSGNNAATDNINFTTLSLHVGQIIHIGGLTGANQFANGAGYGRITSITAGAITLDKLSSTIATDTGAAQTIDLLFGRFIRDVDVDDADFIQRSFTFEGAYPNLGTGGVTEYEYPNGNFCNQMQFNLPLTDKATVTFGFVGLDTPVPTSTRKTGGDSAVDPLLTSMFNTSSDIARIRITQVDETGLTTDFKSLKVTLNNNVTPEKVLGTLGGKYMNIGNFEVDIEAQLLFTDPAVVTAIRNNTTVTMDFGITNDEGAIFVDIPSLTLGDGKKEFPVNASVLINVTVQPYGDPTLGTSIGISMLPVVP